MNTLKNKVQLIGHLGQAPEMITFENGKQLARISLATNESYKNAQGEKVNDVQWHNAIAWGKRAAFIETHVKKGQEVAIEGKLIHSSYQTKSGETRYKTEIQINEIVSLGRRVEDKK